MWQNKSQHLLSLHGIAYAIVTEAVILQAVSLSVMKESHV